MKSWHVVAIAVALVIALQQGAPHLLPGRLPDMVELDDPPGFRAVPRAATSPGSAIFAGLDPATAVPEVQGDFCQALFPPADTGVPVAYFLDYNCPYCRELSRILAQTDGITLRRHWLSGLGSSSLTAARAAVAAESLGVGDAMYARLSRSVVVANAGYLRALAEGIGIDPDQLIAAMTSPQTDAALENSAALARRFALPGTPALVVGRTLVVGEIDANTLDTLVAHEAAAQRPC
ncbi:DsbA family protein [Aliiroseovarius sp. PTFE2010]|uniref:DsbA family protein n=1 Tax=Aliiroseovarius sp. PTFE2010 TaxID=3417190 RepID=UPI003CE7F68E